MARKGEAKGRVILHDPPFFKKEWQLQNRFDVAK
jgi:hypothetical protein